MHAVILAAGRGSRMGSFTSTQPKPLLKIAGKSLIERCIESLPNAISRCTVVVGYEGEQIISSLSQLDGKIEIDFKWQHSYSGTGGGLLVCKSVLPQSNFLVIHGDNLYQKKDLELMIDQECVIYGIVKEAAVRNNQRNVLFDSTKRLVGWNTRRKGEERWFGAGAYVLSEEIWDTPFIQLPNGELTIPHTLHELQAPTYVHQLSDWYSVNTADELISARRAYF